MLCRGQQAFFAPFWHWKFFTFQLLFVFFDCSLSSVFSPKPDFNLLQPVLLLLLLLLLLLPLTVMHTPFKNLYGPFYL